MTKLELWGVDRALVLVAEANQEITVGIVAVQKASGTVYDEGHFKTAQNMLREATNLFAALSQQGAQ